MAVPQGCPILVDGLAYGVLPEAAAQIARGHPLIAVVHHPLAMESGLSPAVAAELRASERAALAAARHVVANSKATARLLAADYDVPMECITVAVPGTDPEPPAHGSSDGMVRLLSVGAVVPRKGFDMLIAALATLTELSWHLTIAGDRTRDADCAAQLEADIARSGLSERVAMLGAVSQERLSGLYAGADIFALPSRFEGYGMAFSEAIGRGLPVIGTTTAAIQETIPPGTCVLVAPDDPAALAAALRHLIESADDRRRMAATARAVAQALPRWEDSAKLIADVLERVL
ncbi:MAG TPA: glycosyltransferase family 4 protein [Pseudolabrys sp.]|nr:glycosyltransferase family 4 protein [Pseudolabrys sp.]